MIYNRSVKILALDTATVTGWAVLANGVLTSGSQDFTRHPGNKHRAPDHPGQHFAMFRRWLIAKILETHPTEIAYESPGHFKSGAAVHTCVGLRGILLGVAAEHNLPVYSYSPMTVKKYWTGTGRADKDMMILATKACFPDLELTDANEADAIAILHTHHDQHHGVG